MKLLAPTQAAELPTEALLARLRCRRSALDLLADPGTQESAAEVACWVYRRLNKRLRKKLEPFFDVLAMRSLILSLRYALAGETPPEVVTRHSLLSPWLIQLTKTTEATKHVVAKLEAALAGNYPFVAGLFVTYQSQGPGGMEQQLAEGILRHSLARCDEDPFKVTLRYLIDMRNCQTIHRYWLWQVSQPPSLVAGGTLETTLLMRLWARHDSERLSRLTLRLTGKPLLSGANLGMEQCLLAGMTRLLRHVGRDPLGLGVIVEYLWQAQLAMHNQLLRRSLGTDREALLQEAMLL